SAANEEFSGTEANLTCSPCGNVTPRPPAKAIKEPPSCSNSYRVLKVCALASWWPAGSPAHSQRGRLFAGVAENLKRQRHALRGVSAGDGEAAEPEIISGACEVRCGTGLVDALDRDRRGLGGRHQDRVDVAHRGGEFALV